MMGRSRFDGFLVAIPVFNEERHVTDVLDRVLRYCRDILVIDDGSTDRTPELLRQATTAAPRSAGIRVIQHPENRGYGKSLADAFHYAQRRDYKWLITMDCDEQHEAEQIPRFQFAAQADDADVISGSRYPTGRRVAADVPPDRREINSRITALLNARLGLTLTDAFCGFKAYRVSMLRHLDITVPGYAMPMQFWVQAAVSGLRIKELPVRLIYNDPTRHFGGLLDDPAARFAHYVAVLEAEIAAASESHEQNEAGCIGCR